jgi:TM2 domain
MTATSRYRSKTLAAWLALLLGSLGAHRLYLMGLNDRRAWLYPLPTLIGLFGAMRLRFLGQDDALGSMLVPLLGLSLSWAMLMAIVMALTPDAKWDARYNPGQDGHATGWGAVLAAMAGLFVGTVVLISTVAFGGQRFFEWQVEHAAVSAPSARGG